MKYLPLFSLMFIGVIMPCFAEILEFREFSLERSAEQKALTIEQIQKEIFKSDLGSDKSIKVKVKNAKFTYVDTKPMKYAVEYNKDLSIAKFGSKDLGFVIKGTATELDDFLSVTFSYSHLEKAKDVVHEVNNGGVVLMPVFNHVKISHLFRCLWIQKCRLMLLLSC